jgi:hypothetical protein
LIGGLCTGFLITSIIATVIFFTVIPYFRYVSLSLWWQPEAMQQRRASHDGDTFRATESDIELHPTKPGQTGSQLYKWAGPGAGIDSSWKEGSTSTPTPAPIDPSATSSGDGYSTHEFDQLNAALSSLGRTMTTTEIQTYANLRSQPLWNIAMRHVHGLRAKRALFALEGVYANSAVHERQRWSAANPSDADVLFYAAIVDGFDHEAAGTLIANVLLTFTSATVELLVPEYVQFHSDWIYVLDTVRQMGMAHRVILHEAPESIFTWRDATPIVVPPMNPNRHEWVFTLRPETLILEPSVIDRYINKLRLTTVQKPALSAIRPSGAEFESRMLLKLDAWYSKGSALQALVNTGGFAGDTSVGKWMYSTIASTLYVDDLYLVQNDGHDQIKDGRSETGRDNINNKPQQKKRTVVSGSKALGSDASYDLDKCLYDFDMALRWLVRHTPVVLEDIPLQWGLEAGS